MTQWTGVFYQITVMYRIRLYIVPEDQEDVERDTKSKSNSLWDLWGSTRREDVHNQNNKLLKHKVKVNIHPNQDDFSRMTLAPPPPSPPCKVNIPIIKHIF